MILPIRSLSLNSKNLYQADRTPCSEVAQINRERLSPELSPDCKISTVNNSTVRRFDLPVDLEKIDSQFLNRQSPDKSVFFLDFSKYLIHRLSRNGVIEAIPLQGLIYPRQENDFDSDGRKELSQNECLVNCLVPEAFLAEDEKKYSTREAAEAIFQGRYGPELIIKPESGAFASGLMMLRFQDGALEIKVIDPGLHQEFLRASRNIVKYCQREGLQEINEKQGSKTFRLNLKDLNPAKEKLEQLIEIALIETANPRFVTKHKDTAHINCGLIEPKLNLVTSPEGKALEARYFCSIDEGGRFTRSPGFYYDQSGQAFPYFSFMKGGQSPDFVNCGDLLATNDQTLEPLILASGIKAQAQDYQEYVYNLLEAQAQHIRAQAMQAGIVRQDEPMGFVFDIAWRKNDFMTVAQANGHGLIKVPRPVQMEALLQLPLTDEFMLKAQDAKRIDLESIYRKDPEIGERIINHSKLFHRLIAQGGPIDLSNNLTVLHPFHPGDFEQDGWKRCTESMPRGGDYHYYIYNEMLPDEITRYTTNKLTQEFVSEFIDGQHPPRLVIKPDQSSLGDGQIRLAREDDRVVIKIVDLSQDHILGASRYLHAIIVANSADIEELNNDNDGTRTFAVSLDDKSKATEAITDIINASLSRRYDRYQQSIFGSIEAGVPDYAQGHIKQIADSGHAEAQENLLKIDGHIVEGRYFIDPIMGEDVKLSIGLRQTEDRGQDFSPSFMKVGQGAIVVNRGSGGKAWPDMHDKLIKSNGLDLNKDEFNDYMRKLVYKEAKHIYGKLSDQGVRIDSISIDVAWDANDRTEVPTGSGGTMLVPRPILMEWNFFNR